MSDPFHTHVTTPHPAITGGVLTYLVIVVAVVGILGVCALLARIAGGGGRAVVAVAALLVLSAFGVVAEQGLIAGVVQAGLWWPLTLVGLVALACLTAVMRGTRRQRRSDALVAAVEPYRLTPLRTLPVNYGPLQRVATLTCPVALDGIHVPPPWEGDDRECIACLDVLTTAQHDRLVETLAENYHTVGAARWHQLTGLVARCPVTVDGLHVKPRWNYDPRPCVACQPD